VATQMRVLVLCLGLALTGCSAPSVPSSDRPVQMPVDPKTVARIQHGDKLAGVALQRGNPRALDISLVSGGPTGAAPFAILAALSQQVAGDGVLSQVKYTRHSLANARTVYTYRWDARRQVVTLEEYQMAMSSGLMLFRGVASQIDTAGLAAIGDKSQPVPEFQPMTDP
jgi:hypothetical protein